MKRLLVLAMPLLLSGFALPKASPETKGTIVNARVVAPSLDVTCCTATHIRVRIVDPSGPLPSGTIYWYVDGIYTGVTGRLFQVPKTALNVYATVGATLPGTMLTGSSVTDLLAQCSSVCP